jgi:putative flavoprotein involved in K+ transport
MQFATTVVIGAGHTGLAASACLDQQGVDHVLLERGEVANSWRQERWDSLKLLTPNFQCALPGARYEGDDPEGFMSMPEVIDFISGYANTIHAPVHTETEVTRVTRAEDGYALETSQGPWACRTLVLAGGACNLANVPELSASLPADIHQVTPLDYKTPEQLPEGGVLVVGASATGVQLADEIHRSGRPVTLCVGEHVRMPRTYRGRDILYWMSAAGILNEGLEEIDDVTRARNIPSPQLVGTPERKQVDINALTDIGVDVVGRFVGLNGTTAQFAGSLKNNCALADLKCNRLLGTIDEWIAEQGMEGETPAPDRLESTRVPDRPALGINLGDGRIKSVVWATGYRPDYSWLDVPVLDRKGKLVHEAGVVNAPGLYTLGLTFLRTRKSTFIHGAEDDARYITEHLKNCLG